MDLREEFLDLSSGGRGRGRKAMGGGKGEEGARRASLSREGGEEGEVG